MFFPSGQNIDSSFVIERPSGGPATKWGTNVHEIQKQREYDKKVEKLNEEFAKVDIDSNGFITEPELFRFLEDCVLFFQCFF